MEQVQTGKVKWFNPAKAYGFLTLPDGKDVFVHKRGIVDGREWLVDGQGVAFIVRRGAKGPEAEEVRVTEDVAEVPARRLREMEEGGRPVERAGSVGGGSRRPRETYTGPIPSGPVRARVAHVERTASFLFAKVDDYGFDVFVPSELWSIHGRDPRPGDSIVVTCERATRGPRATSFSWS